MYRNSPINIWFLIVSMAVALCGCNTSPKAKESKYLKRGEALLAQHDFSRALLEFRNASKAVPNDAEPFYQMGLAYLGSDDLVKASRAFRKATELNPNHTEAQLKLAKLLESTRSKSLIEDASKRLETILTNSPDNSDASDTLAMAELKLGKDEDATKRLEETLAKFPSHLQSAVELAKSKMSRNDPAGAQEVLQKAVASAPQSPQAALALGLFG